MRRSNCDALVKASTRHCEKAQNRTKQSRRARESISTSLRGGTEPTKQSRGARSGIQLAIASKDVVVVKRDPPLGRDVALDAWPCEDFVVKRGQPWVRLKRVAARFWERIAQPR